MRCVGRWGSVGIDWLLTRLDGVRKSGNGWAARCPAHDDSEPSLRIEERGETVLLHCFAGCATEDVLAACGATWADIYPPKPQGETQPSDASKKYAQRLLPGDRVRWRPEQVRDYHLAFCEVCASDMAAGQIIGRDDLEKLKEARAWLAAHPLQEPKT